MMASQDDVERRAADWLALMEEGSASEAVNSEFEAWCRSDPRHLAAYLTLLHAWNRLDALAALPARRDAAASGRR
jgi:transmembrane sensor